MQQHNWNAKPSSVIVENRQRRTTKKNTNTRDAVNAVKKTHIIDKNKSFSLRTTTKQSKGRENVFSKKQQKKTTTHVHKVQNTRT